MIAAVDVPDPDSGVVLFDDDHYYMGSVVAEKLARAGLAVTLITQKAVELLGPLGYSRRYLVEKWMRDAKINDIFEGTQQINMIIVARRILEYSSKELN